ncbi:hypothetical protein [Catenuloplanes japonicus]|uniref:hypothetical protein n=1 Tax=Catenuloplanes japonicus TaxID=33876 RepID=UPI0005257A73|nr:hypothetical protein [Catenuloplanes japonicus]
MSSILEAEEADIGVAYRLVELFDGEGDEALPTPRTVGHAWVSAGILTVLLESPEDISRPRVQAWAAARSVTMGGCRRAS